MKKKLMKKQGSSKKPTDLTLRNLRALKKRVERLEVVTEHLLKHVHC